MTMCFILNTLVAGGQSSSAIFPDANRTAPTPGNQTNSKVDSPPFHPPGLANDNDPGNARQQDIDGNEIPDEPRPSETQNKLITLPSAILHDQFGLWESPSKVRLTEATWLVPLGGMTAAFLATDADFNRHLSDNPNTLARYRHFSDYGVYSMGGGAAGLYLLGLIAHNDHEREAGFLSGEATLDTLAVTELLSLATRRQRPLEGNGGGHFWKGGSSFPSDHAAAAWSIAAMVSHEYPSPFLRFLSYGMATAISLSRIEARQHFPSDVLVGSAIGYLISSYVYRQHHDPEVRGAAWEIPALRPESPKRWPSKFMGSPYVPLDSWIYPALERLAALGYINTAIAAMRPWTRMESARQVEEAGDRVNGEDDVAGSEAARLYRDLQAEFSDEITLLDGGNNGDIRLESSYTRTTEIAGKPLTDSYHFGETVVNDFGRPEEQGFNDVSGFSAWGTAGPFAVYLRSEYQHAPWAPALPLAARQAISIADFGRSIVPAPFPVPPGTPTAAVDRPYLLDSYVAMNVADWQLSYGKQSLWWGPDEGGGMMFSDNADPLRMFRVNRITPFRLPSIFGVLGPMRTEFFIGQYAGYEFMFTPTGLVGQYGESLHPQPIVHGERFSFKPTSHFEFGLSRTTDYGGPGYPLTWHSFLRSVFSTEATIPGAANKPGSRRSGLDFNYRINDGITFYADGFTEHDTFSPIVGPDTAAWLGGIYFPRLPKLAKLDFRAEGVYTDPPIGGNVGSGFFYYDPTWISGFTSHGQLMGNWVGREGQGVQAWSTYWFTPRSKLQFEFRHLKVSHEFITNGGTLTDAGVHADFWLHSSVSLSAGVQYEKWNFPVISSTQQANVTSLVELSFWPKGRSRRSPDQ
jgi:membrane-associated phospholipid phosphatase